MKIGEYYKRESGRESIRVTKPRINNHKDYLSYLPQNPPYLIK